ncbi:MAG: hypothetical protein CMN55_12780 [Sneathiella sp.]|jgi:hypothetical protein|uniref:hypothetical protein n=1 Tax=Sneathiella sp. TaxID=1964365 RepID=UPI000C41E841|nr:hypothetical protein [Sneathiella sp.]MAL79967.1 hypothetical protein [Sneathiella sp.]
MSGAFKSKFPVVSSLQRALVLTRGMNRLFFMQSRGYRFTSLPDYDMTKAKYRTKGGDMFGCYMEEAAFEKYYKDVCKRLDVPVELDSATSDLINMLTLSKYDDIVDIHGQISSPKENVRAPIQNIGGQEEDAPKEITWPAQYSDPVASVGGMIRNVLYASLQSEVERNLKFVESLAGQIDEGEGQMGSVVQYYVGRGPNVPFSALNFLLKQKSGKALSEEELQEEGAVTKMINAYLNGILPGAAASFKIDMKKQGISAVHIQSPHSSAVVKYRLKNGKSGYMGAEVGRPSFTYVNGKLVMNAHEQVVDPAVFQSMNRQRLAPKDLPLTIEDYRKRETGVTLENFFLQDASVKYDQLSAENQPLVKTVSLVDHETGKGQAVYLSDGVPAASVIHKVPYAGRLAKVLYFLTGQYPWEALRFGGYFAHDALTGQSRACEALVVFGSDIAGIKPQELLPVLAGLDQYDLSQEMRESVYENILFAELADPSKSDVSSSIFSEKAAKDYLTLSANAFVTMQLYKDLLQTAESAIKAAKLLGKTDVEAESVRDLVLSQTKNFMRRYAHMWAIGAALTINLHKNYGAALFLDTPPKEVSIADALKEKAPSSGTLLFMVKFVTEKRDALKTAPDGESEKSRKVRENSLDLAEKSLKYIAGIKSELGIKD